MHTAHQSVKNAAKTLLGVNIMYALNKDLKPAT